MNAMAGCHESRRDERKQMPTTRCTFLQVVMLGPGHRPGLHRDH